MTIEYQPSMLESIIKSPLAEKRLKNRQAELICETCGNNQTGLVLDLFSLALKEPADHKVTLREVVCRNSLINW